jgi:predicted kinase
VSGNDRNFVTPRPVALWMIGPVGSGKSTHISDLKGFAIVDQDIELERLLKSSGLSLDTREYDSDQAARFTALRAEASDRTWKLVPELRRRGQSIVFETSGNKPWLLAKEVELNRQAGYDNLGVGVWCSLEDCLARNRNRSRVLPDAVVRDTWKAFHQYLDAGVYDQIFGEGRFICLRHHDRTDIGAWVRTLLNEPS